MSQALRTAYEAEGNLGQCQMPNAMGAQRRKYRLDRARTGVFKLNFLALKWPLFKHPNFTQAHYGQYLTH